MCAAINVSALTDTIIATERYDKLFGPIPGSYVTFGCKEGSTVVVESIYCLSHGNWSAKPPFCSRGKVFILLSLYNALNKHLQFLKFTCINLGKACFNAGFLVSARFYVDKHMHFFFLLSVTSNLLPLVVVYTCMYGKVQTCTCMYMYLAAFNGWLYVWKGTCISCCINIRLCCCSISYTWHGLQPGHHSSLVT